MAAAVSLLCRVMGFRDVGGCGYPPLPCRASPPQVGRSTRSKVSPSLTVEIAQRRRVLPISLLVGEMPGRAEGGKRHTPKRGYFPYRFSSSTIAGLRGRPFPIVRLLQTKNPRPKAEDDSWSAALASRARCLMRQPRATHARLPVLPSAPLPAPSQRREPRSGARVRG